MNNGNNLGVDGSTLVASHLGNQTPELPNHAETWKFRTGIDRSGWFATGSWQHLLMIPLSLVTFFIYFRPWGEGLVEDWDFIFYNHIWGFWGTLTSQVGFEFLGRPFAVPLNVGGFALSGGAWWGQYLLLAVISLLRLWVTPWALKPIMPSRLLRFAFATAIALQPLWDAAIMLRFLNNHFAMLMLIVWVGALVRWLKLGQRRWLVAAFCFPLLALLSYQGTTLAIGLGAIALVFAIPSTARSRWAVLIASAAGVVAAMGWAIVIAPRLIGGGYMASAANNYHGLIRSITTSFNMIRTFVPAAIVMLVILLAIVCYLAAKQLVSPVTAVVLGLTVLATPLSALVFVTDYGWMQDPERTSIPISMAIWFIAIALAAIAFGTTAQQREQVEFEAETSYSHLPNQKLALSVTAALVVAGSIVLSGMNYHVFTTYEHNNQLLLDQLTQLFNQTGTTTTDEVGVPCFPEAGDLCGVVVLDDSGEYGQIYSLGFPSLYMASLTRFQEPYTPGPVRATMCTPAAVLHERRDALAAAGLIHQRDWIRNPACEELLVNYATEPIGYLLLENGAELRVVQVTGLSPAALVTPANENMPTEATADEFWWWISDEPESFTIGDGETPIAGMQFEIWAPACAPASTSVTVDGGGQTQVFDLDQELGQRTLLEVKFDQPTPVVQVTVTPNSPSCQVPGDPRNFGPALANLQLDWLPN